MLAQFRVFSSPPPPTRRFHRLCALDPACALLPGDPYQDIGLEADSFALPDTSMQGIMQIFISENRLKSALTRL